MFIRMAGSVPPVYVVKMLFDSVVPPPALAGRRVALSVPHPRADPVRSRPPTTTFTLIVPYTPPATVGVDRPKLMAIGSLTNRLLVIVPPARIWTPWLPALAMMLPVTVTFVL